MRKAESFLSFNRTSLESKPFHRQDRLCAVGNLLIEPVWNRNIFKRERAEIIHSFNRTSLESKRVLALPQQTNQGLLIEPVWNRNSIKA